MSEPTFYRSGVGIVLINRRGDVFVAQRGDLRDPPWQMPQGDLEPGETPERAATRILIETIGHGNAVPLASCPHWLHYEYPPSAARRALQYRGQRHKWYLMRHEDEDSSIAIGTDHPRYRAWRWTTPADAIMSVIGFKQDVYRAVLHYFARHLHEVKAVTSPIPSSLISPGREMAKSFVLADVKAD